MNKSAPLTHNEYSHGGPDNVGYCIVYPALHWLQVGVPGVQECQVISRVAGTLKEVVANEQLSAQHEQNTEGVG